MVIHHEMMVMQIKMPGVFVAVVRLVNNPQPVGQRGDRHSVIVRIRGNVRVERQFQIAEQVPMTVAALGGGEISDRNRSADFMAVTLRAAGNVVVFGRVCGVRIVRSAVLP